MTSEEMGKLYRLGSANYIRSKVNWAYMQTSELGRTRTIIIVNADEAMVICWALEEYIDKYRKRIDAQEAIERRDDNGRLPVPDGWIITPEAKGRTEIELVPRELVRCKNCKRFPNCCLLPRNDPDWFCADGERREDNDGD